MNLKTLTSFVILFALLSLQSNSQWQQTAMTTTSISSLAATQSHIFCGNGSIYSSSDNGVSWNHVGTGETVNEISSNSNYVYGLMSGYPRVYISSNNGSNWTYNNNLSAADGIWSIYSRENNVYAGLIHYGIRISTDNGESWSGANISGTFYCIAADENNIFAGREETGLYRSTNNGVNWTSTTVSSRVISLKINGNFVYAGTESSGVYRSTNNGESWSQTSLNNQKVWSIEAEGNNVYAGTNLNGVYVSNDNGATWVQKNEGLTNLWVSALTIKDNYLYAGTSGAGVWKRSLTELVGINIISNEVPNEYNLYQNYPNPFNPATKIKFAVPKQGSVMLNIYSSNGQLVQTWVNQNLSAGTYEADFDGSGLASGIYFYSLTSGDFTKTNKMILFK